MGKIEERRHPRVTVDFFADWGWTADCEFYDRITSLSISGCFLATRQEVSAGQEIFLRFKEESAGMVNLKGTVRHQVRLMEGATPTGAGIEFLNVSLDVLKKLESVMAGYH